MPYSSGGGKVTVGTTVVGGTADTILYIDASGNLASASWLGAVGAGSGTSAITFTKTMSGSSATSNFFNLTGTIPTSTVLASAGYIAATNAATNSLGEAALTVGIVANVASRKHALYAVMDGVGASGGSSAVYGAATMRASISASYGVMGGIKQGGGYGAGGFFWLHSGTAGSLTSLGDAPPVINTQDALRASNATTTANIFSLYDNTTVKVTVLDGGHAAFYNMALTAGTMTVENSAQLRTTTHSFTWTNAQVVALGAALTGDITVCTLPAKTVVLNAYVVITGQGAGTTTLTVALGRTAAGYIDYIVASDAQAAADTVYGNAAAERGTNLTGYDLPSYTATTDVKCHFISTGANLDQVTGSTGRVVLVTSLVP